ncbi:ATP-binding cassette a-factor transporter STE6 KNAG_0G00190 [Huiozyma naganishii CBS 8797]|uniref:Uncharacterized protein n=1 Tax=Huiozyma naganishii (strain ATCC MYA-139 / BCRC 22969 / CBS 8797 / KCTC 17520 / NBRC 10181 / NCYC 3082 / Yp74L-3) TaxID=1071383 RepID=J7S0N8_HUIN7|nr:hypothetical protein KNAG_0G00190 [Kazachstania naganishii CBS 8797]CCK71077.1 hypothetical protein KNAG_0G00190 [Kazachstania naganishii CBS 8797]
MNSHIFANVSPEKDYKLLTVVTLTTIASGLIPAITSILTGRVFDILSNISLNDRQFSHQLVLRSMSVMILGAASFPVMWIFITSWMHLGEVQGDRIRINMLGSYLSKSWTWYDGNGKRLLGEFTQLSRCIEEVRQSSSESAAITLQSFVSVLSLIGTSFYYSWSLTLIILCSTPIITAIAIYFAKLTNKYTDLENKETSYAAELLTWSMRFNDMVKFYTAQNEEISKFDTSVTRCNSLFIKACLYSALNSSIIRFLTLCMFVQGFWFGATMIRRNKLDINDVITCFHSCLMLGATVSEAMSQVTVIQKGHVANKKLEGFLELEGKTIMQAALKCPPKGNSLSITFNNISFKYPCRTSNSAVENVSLRLESGKMTFIIGKSGSGKSTLAKLLLRFYEEYSGSITVDNISICDLNQEWLLSNITVVEQNCTLFNDTLRNNILLGSENQSEPARMESIEERERKLRKACNFALLNEMLADLTDGLDTVIGSGGVELSGGQRQRVALARAFLRNTPIMIFDESVSALDVAHRKLLMKAIRSWRQGKTTIVLTHELSQINPTDFIYIMEHGRVCEYGYQEDLLKSETSYFSRFYQHQAPEGAVHESLPRYDTFRNSIVSDTKTPVTDIIDKEGKTWVDQNSEIETLKGSYYISEKLSGSSNTSSQSESDLEETNDGRKSFNKEDLEKGVDEPIMNLKSIVKCMVKEAQYKGVLCVGIVFALCAGAANPVFSYSFSYLLNGIIPVHGTVGSSFYLLKWSLIVLSVAIIDAFCTFSKTFIMGYCSEYWIMDLRKKVMRTITYNKFEWFQLAENKPSEVSALALNDLRDLRTLVTEFLATASTFLVVSTCGLIWALVAGWKLSLVSISMFPLIIVFSGVYGAALQKCETDYKSAVAQLENCLYEVVVSMKTIRCLQLQTHFQNRYDRRKQRMLSLGRRRSVITGCGIAITHTLTLCIQAILYYYGIKLVIDGKYTSKKMFEVFTLILFTIMTCTNLINQIPEVTRGQRAATYIYRILKEAAATREHQDMHNRTLPISNTSEKDTMVLVKDLTFAYPATPSKHVYEHLNLNLKSDTSVALVGESGSGKSTIISLLTKLYDVPEKHIYVDGTDLSEWDTNSLRNQISVVEQSANLLNGTIRENLTYGLPEEDTTEVDLIGILKLVSIYDFVSRLPNGIDTIVDRDLLSGGQAQRLCIARALVKPHRILILDECTSALDALSTNIIIDIVRKGIPNTLIIAITHDEHMMRSCESVLLLKNGAIVEQGSFVELMQQDSEFKKCLNGR